MRALQTLSSQLTTQRQKSFELDTNASQACVKLSFQTLNSKPLTFWIRSQVAKWK